MAQVTDVLSYVIDKSETSVAEKSLESAVSGDPMLSVLSGLAGEANSGECADDIMGVISAVNGKGKVRISTPFSAVSPLNYVTYVYSMNDYHRSGSLLNSSRATSNSGSSGRIYSSMRSPEWGRITSGFGYRAQFGRLHKGVDFAMSKGDTVKVPLAGRIDRVDFESGGYGHFIVVKHDNGMETRYAHLSSTLVREGEYVSTGQPIALSGNTGNSTGPHLHFETRYMGAAVDPMSVFDFGSGYLRAYYRQSETAGATERIATGLNGSKTSLVRKSTYIVREGDTVSKIAKRAGITTLRLCQLNFITENEPLAPGRMLKLR